MSEFWLWFWRPIAEFLGAFALICGVFAVYIVIMIGVETFKHWRRK